jgi:NADH:ubiquinone oxidoreductase subunit K
MNLEHMLLFVTFCGLLGIFLRRNFLNITVSFLQIAIGINALFGINSIPENKNYYLFYLIIFAIFILIIFFHAIAALSIKRRSTLNVNELTELRG